MTRVEFNTRAGKGVPYNESVIDVSHMDDEGQREVLSLLRSGRCRDGKLRRVEGRKRLDDGSLTFEAYNPSADITGRLV
ncbi:MAG: hypothetical protein KAJ19_18805, partial [Gammaproteobacteria bacterium]|nr:hypothetical protein [Gammaproteobacteria bacterium]